jgi:hypothetical protein
MKPGPLRRARKQDLLLASDALRANAQLRMQGLAGLSSTRLAARWTLAAMRALRQTGSGPTQAGKAARHGKGTKGSESAWALWAGALALEWLPAALPRLAASTWPLVLRWAGPALAARWRAKP